MKEKIVKKGIKKVLSCVVLALAMVLVMMPAMRMTVMAGAATVADYNVVVPEGVTAPDGAQTVLPVPEPETPMDDEVVWNEGWYVVSDNVTMDVNRGVKVYGNVNLILAGNLTINCEDRGVKVNDDSSLTIWSTADVGKMTINAGNGQFTADLNDSNIIINGGEIKSISSRIPGVAGPLTMNAGKLIAITEASDFGGLGGDAPITVNGGTIEASGGYGILFMYGNNDMNLHVTGGTVELTGTTQAVFSDNIDNGGVDAFADAITIGENLGVERGSSKASELTSVTLGAGEKWVKKLNADTEAKYVKISAKAHEHDWEYSLDGTSTIKATCKGAGDCDLDDGKVSVTLKEDLANFKGDVTISGLDKFNEVTGANVKVDDLVYYKVNTLITTGGTKLSEKPTKQGYYYAELKVGDVAAKVAYTIIEPVTPPTVEYYKDVPPTTGEVKDITGSDEASKESNPYSVSIVNSSELEKLIKVSAAEKAQGVNVWVAIVDATSTMPAADKAAIDKAAGSSTVGMYLDASLFKKVGNKNEEAVHELSDKIKLSIVIPEKLRKEGRTFEIIRIHGGEATTIEGTYDEATHTFTFGTDRFSSYALTYKDEAATTAPKTGDTTNMYQWILLMVAGFGMVCVAYSKKRKDI